MRLLHLGIVSQNHICLTTGNTNKNNKIQGFIHNNGKYNKKINLPVIPVLKRLKKED